jgi:hypothetical protein
MAAVTAADRLAALKRHIHVAVAAFVVDCSRGSVDGGGVVGRGITASVLLRHFFSLLSLFLRWKERV